MRVLRAWGSNSTSRRVPLGGYAEVKNGKLRMRGFVASPDGQRMMRSEAVGDVAHPEALGNKIADELRAQGADVILAELAL